MAKSLRQLDLILSRSLVNPRKIAERSEQIAKEIEGNIKSKEKLFEPVS
jgi:hypothetical protein